MVAGASTGTVGILRAAVAAATILLLTVTALGEVTTSDVTRTHKVAGTTAKALVANMTRHPFAGDHGAAFANIRPRYTLSVETKQSGSQCRATTVAVKINFTTTLPEASQRGQMSKAVRNAWDNFANFAKRHEEAHRASYIGCARAFVSKAKQQRHVSCGGVESAIRQSFDRMKRECEAKQAAFDRVEKRKVPRLTLFNMAGY